MRKQLILLLLIIFASLSAFTQNLPVKRFALFIGANMGGEGRQSLLYAQRDAKEMATVIEEIGGVAAPDRQILLDPKPQEILTAFDRMANLMRQDIQKSRRIEFLFYYSGHSDETGLLLGSSELTYRDLRSRLQDLPADIKIAILDSCSSGAFARLKGGVQKSPFLEQDGAQMKGHAFLTSSSENESSQESDTLQGSFFTHFLISGLRGGADRAKNGLITLNEAYEYAFQNTLERTETTKAGPQHPSYDIQISGTGELVLTDIKTSNTRLELASDVAGKIYIRNSRGALLVETNKKEGLPMQLAVPADVYTVTAVTPVKAYSARISLPPQKITPLKLDDLRSQDLSRFAARGKTRTPVDPNDDREIPTPRENSQPRDPSGVPEHFYPLNIGLWPGLETTPPGSSRQLSANLFVDVSRKIAGLQGAGLIAITDSSMTGLQVAGVGSIANGATGLQLSYLFNIANEEFQGVQYSNLFNIANGKEIGYIQSSNLFNIANGNFTGVQATGLFNIATEKTFTGIQAAGLFNIAPDVNGIQVGTLFNVAGEVSGLQVGLVDINSHMDGAGIGLLFLSPEAYYRPHIQIDHRGNSYASIQWGMGWFYWVLGGVFNNRDQGNPTAGGMAGLGLHLAEKTFYFDLDAGSLKSPLKINDAGLGECIFGSRDQGDILPYIRPILGISSGWIALEGGCLVSMGIPGVTKEASCHSDGFLSGNYDSRVYFQTSWFIGLRFF